jgi:hypothetical protein
MSYARLFAVCCLMVAPAAISAQSNFHDLLPESTAAMLQIQEPGEILQQILTHPGVGDYSRGGLSQSQPFAFRIDGYLAHMPPQNSTAGSWLDWAIGHNGITRITKCADPAPRRRKATTGARSSYPRAISIRSLEQFKLRRNQQAIAAAVAQGQAADPEGKKNGLLDFVQSSTSAALKTSKELIKSAAQDVKRNDAVTYANSALAQKLQTTAQLIDSPLNARVTMSHLTDLTRTPNKPTHIKSSVGNGRVHWEHSLPISNNVATNNG